MPEPQQPIPAATLIVLRPCESGAPELLMVERAAAMRFAGGAMVFPGGRVDPGDRVFAAMIGMDSDDGAARVAAIRETIEEAGLAIGVAGLGDVEAARAAFHDGATAAEVFAGCEVRLDALVPFARWLPHLGVAHRVFDTRFYVASADDGVGTAVVDGGENVRLIWSRARDVLADADLERVRLIFPTRRNLERVALFADFADAAADARAHPVNDPITPWIETRDGEARLCIPEGRGYPVTSQPVGAALRA